MKGERYEINRWRGRKGPGHAWCIGNINGLVLILIILKRNLSISSRGDRWPDLNLPLYPMHSFIFII